MHPESQQRDRTHFLFVCVKEARKDAAGTDECARMCVCLSLSLRGAVSIVYRDRAADDQCCSAEAARVPVSSETRNAPGLGRANRVLCQRRQQL